MTHVLEDEFDDPGDAVDPNAVKRDRWDRPLLPPVNLALSRAEGDERPFTRCTTFAGSLDEQSNLSLWSQRLVAKGMAERDDLRLLARSATLEDKQTLNEVISAAKELAGGPSSSRLGTALHSFTELRDRGGSDEDIDPKMLPRVEAYSDALRAHGIEIMPEYIERLVCWEKYSVSGTFDRIVMYKGQPTILDLKGLALTEKIPTPSGWTTMGDVQAGDVVFDAFGTPCTVTHKSESKRIGTYVVKFNDGSSVVCDSEHIWWTQDVNLETEPSAKSINQVMRTLTIGKKRPQSRHAVPVAGSLDLPDRELPIDPYLLGCWLGDGNVRDGGVTKTPDLFEILEADGHALGVVQWKEGNASIQRTVLGLKPLLDAHGLTHNKHIPPAYLRASRAQRLRLLQGLMDTDGTWNVARRSAVFTNTDKELSYQVEELLCSLGQRPYVCEVTYNGFGLTVLGYPVEFTPLGIEPFRLPRKSAAYAAAIPKNLKHSNRRLIQSVTPGPDVESACIAVDSPTRTYLCTEKMIPTHNTGKDLGYGWLKIAVQLLCYAMADGIWDQPAYRWHPLPEGLMQDIGLVVHLPSTGDVSCTVYEVDLIPAVAAAQLCSDVRDWRKTRGISTKLKTASELGEMVGEAAAEVVKKRRSPRKKAEPVVEVLEGAALDAEVKAIGRCTYCGKEHVEMTCPEAPKDDSWIWPWAKPEPVEDAPKATLTPDEARDDLYARIDARIEAEHAAAIDVEVTTTESDIVADISLVSEDDDPFADLPVEIDLDHAVTPEEKYTALIRGAATPAELSTIRKEAMEEEAWSDTLLKLGMERLAELKK